MDDPSTTSITEGFGLMFYREASLWDNARWYDPTLGRFAQAETIVPDGYRDWIDIRTQALILITSTI
jgi:hypothetical protein